MGSQEREVKHLNEMDDATEYPTKPATKHAHGRSTMGDTSAVYRCIFSLSLSRERSRRRRPLWPRDAHCRACKTSATATGGETVHK